MNSHVLLVVLAAPLLVSAALADQEDTEKTQARFEALDRDADKRISKSEAKSSRELASRFASVDADADGYLSSEEFIARPTGERFE